MELAYIFWHHRRHSVSDEHYREAVAAFHERLAMNPPTGFVSSFSRRQNELPWMPAKVEIYEDWYIIENYAALEHLNAHAARGDMESTHDSVAELSATGSGAIYSLMFNHSEDVDLKSIVWFDKTQLTKTKDFLATVDMKTKDNHGIAWRRQLSLGPAPEFVVWMPGGKPLLVEGSRQFPFNRV